MPRPVVPVPRTRRHRRLVGWLLAGLVAVLVVTAYAPFRWDPPRPVTNGVDRTAPHVLTFGDRNAARSAGAPAWLDEVRKGRRLQIDLEAKPRFPQLHHRAPVMMVADDFWNTNVAVVQDGTGLMLWLRRVGANDNGDPPFYVADAFRPGHWTAVHVIVQHDRLIVRVDGATRLSEPLPAGSLRTWTEGTLALGDEVRGGRAWQGAIRRAEVRTPGHAVDYVQPGALEVPQRYLYLPDRVVPFPPPSRLEWLILLLHFLSFVPLGLLATWAQRPPPRALGGVRAMLVVCGIAVALAAGKFLFADRHTAVADLVVQFAGAALGALVAYRLGERSAR
ncbi:MAG: hypothetical protein GEV04_22325 [Actinophytocola sp.]|nr:hypothetical protein [Actinophytocola sp.]